MELITILNRGHRFQGFVSRPPRFSADKKSIEVGVRPRKGSAAVGSRCHFPTPGYDQLSEACREIYREIETTEDESAGRCELSAKNALDARRAEVGRPP